MTVKIERTAKLGESPKMTLTIDGEVVNNEYYYVSRSLTQTNNESGGGVFYSGDESEQRWFYRNSDAVEVEILPSICTAFTASENMANLKKNVAAVKDAFAQKFPAINESAEAEF